MVKKTKKSTSPQRFLSRYVLLVPVFFLAILLIAAGFYYQPMKIWYREVRAERVLRAELIAIKKYNADLKQEISSLETTEGVSDYARSQLNLTTKGDNTIIVLQNGKPIDTSKKSRESQIANIPKNTKPFGTWTGFLDSFFGIE